MPTSPHDRDILRRLAGALRGHAERPVMAERKARLKALNALRPDRPVVLCYPEGSWPELVPPDECRCADPLLRAWELQMRGLVYWAEHIDDDNALEPCFDVRWVVRDDGYGVEVPYTHGANRGSYVWEAPLKNLPADLDRLHFRRPTVDRRETARRLALAGELFGDLLTPRLKGAFGWTCGLTTDAIRLIGLERLMLAMYDEPQALHRLMAFLRDDMMAYLSWFEAEGLCTLNTTNGYVGSGGVAYTDELPAADWKPGDPVRLRDLWGFAESQETVGVSPAMFAEFILPYQAPLLERFGLNCYGCCEPVHTRWEPIRRIPRLRRVSVSPWCDQPLMAELLGRNYVFSRKPNPAHVCASFNEPAIRADLRSTLDVAGDLPLEIILKDTHTVQGQPWRLGRWVRIAREEIDRRP
ncbi:MAG: hypothetical protein GX591_00500 [Planctomycetes bacterium]|nr:hypothetical protein [Planctomycetota bacterium]